MQAIILAAGMGRRLGEWTKDNTKCMLPIDGARLIDRLLHQLERHNLRRVIMVVGYKGQNVIDYVGSHYDGPLAIEFYDNPIYDRTNNIYSLALVKDKMLEDDTLLVESDIIFSDGIFDLVFADPSPDIALVAKYKPWMDGTMVQIDKDNRILNFIPKEVFSYHDVDSYYKTVNVYKFSRKFCRERYIPFLDAYVKALGNNEYYEQVLRVITLLNNDELKALPIGDLPWYEIDDAQDKDIAETIFSSPEDKLSRYMRRYGGYWRFDGLLDFCYLVNPYFPPQRLVEELKANFGTLLTEYPSGMYVNSLLAAKCFGIRQQYTVVGNGAAELIKSLMERCQGRVGVVYPTFEEYPHRMAEGDIVKFFPQTDDLSYTTDDLMHFFGTKDIRTLLLINPDNPSGNMIPAPDCRRLAAWCQERGVRLVLDESFVDFCEEWETSSFLSNDLLQQYAGMVVVKSISKSFGVPGLRLGVLASADEELVEWLRRDVAIWNINSFAEYYLQIYNKYEKDYKRACQLFQAERRRFQELLSGVGYLRVIPSQANFFLLEITRKFTSHELAQQLLDRFNILVKDCDTKTGLQGRNMIRVAVRCSEDNDRLVSALQALV